MDSFQLAELNDSIAEGIAEIDRGIDSAPSISRECVFALSRLA
jgi:hypothetical protein